MSELKNLQCLSLDHSGWTTAGLKELEHLQRLNLGPIRVNGTMAKEFKEFKSLQILEDIYVQEDAELKSLEGLESLKVLHLAGNGVTDAGIKKLKELKNLHTIWLMRTPVTDAGLKELKELKNLQTLFVLASPKVTDSGLKELKAALPEIRINPPSPRFGNFGHRDHDAVFLGKD